MNIELSDPKMQRIMEEARLERAKEMSRLLGLLFRRRPTAKPSVAVTG